MSSLFLIDPDAQLDYLFDWTSWLASGETITSHSLTATNITVDTDTATTTGVTVWLSAPVAGSRPTVVCHVVTNQGREDDRTMRFRVEQR